MNTNNTLRQVEILDFPLIRKLTGYNSPAKQAECLRSHNIYYIEGKDGRVVTTSAWLAQAATNNVISAANDEVNLDF